MVAVGVVDVGAVAGCEVAVGVLDDGMLDDGAVVPGLLSDGPDCPYADSSSHCCCRCRFFSASSLQSFRFLDRQT